MGRIGFVSVQGRIVPIDRPKVILRTVKVCEGFSIHQKVFIMGIRFSHSVLKDNSYCKGKVGERIRFMFETLTGDTFSDLIYKG